VTDDALSAALVAELGKKTAVSWVRVPGETRSHAIWHTWHDGALCVVSGGDEQPLPHEGMADGDLVEVVLRSKDNGGRLVTWVGRVSVLRPADEVWGPVTDALVADRLNLDDLSTAADEWAERSVVRRIVPTGELVESPGDLSDDAHRAAPLATPAITRGRLPKVLHRRVKRRPKLS
jgi:hypothetical protein